MELSTTGENLVPVNDATREVAWIDLGIINSDDSHVLGGRRGGKRQGEQLLRKASSRRHLRRERSQRYPQPQGVD
jgi:hypothetical protein